MIIYLILIIAAIYLAYQFLLKKSADLPVVEREKFVKRSLWILGGVLLALLAFAKGNVILGAIATLFAFIVRIIPVLIKLFPVFRFFMRQGQENNNQPIVKTSMDKTRAAEILGVAENATKQEIIAAHKRLMQKIHPDKGGSAALAAEINAAKDVLLKK